MAGAARLLTVRLTQAEHERLGRIAGDASMSDVIRRWIASDQAPSERLDPHAACDKRIAELEAQVRRQVSTPAVDTSTVPGLEIHGIAAQGGTAGMAQTDPIHRPAFLAAPDDDCAACGHDRHRWVVDGVCKAPIGRGTCGCTDFATREELTF